MNKKLVFIIILIILVIGVVLFVKNNKDTTKTTIEDGMATSDVKIEKVTFSDIKTEYSDGITTLSAKMTNNSNDTKNFTVNITLKDDDGNVVQSLTQVVEDLEEGKSKILSTGILGDYSNIKDIEFEIDE